MPKMLVLRTPCLGVWYPQGVRVPPVKNHCSMRSRSSQHICAVQECRQESLVKRPVTKILPKAKGQRIYVSVNLFSLQAPLVSHSLFVSVFILSTSLCGLPLPRCKLEENRTATDRDVKMDSRRFGSQKYEELTKCDNHMCNNQKHIDMLEQFTMM